MIKLTKYCSAMILTAYELASAVVRCRDSPLNPITSSFERREEKYAEVAESSSCRVNHEDVKIPEAWAESNLRSELLRRYRNLLDDASFYVCSRWKGLKKRLFSPRQSNSRTYSGSTLEGPSSVDCRIEDIGFSYVERSDAHFSNVRRS